jgi:hypothetical protein
VQQELRRNKPGVRVKLNAAQTLKRSDPAVRDKENAANKARRREAEGIIKLIESRCKNSNGRITFVTEDRDKMLAKVMGACDYCGQPAQGLDRIDGRGPYSDANTVPACTPCNQSKHLYSRSAFICKARRIKAHLNLIPTFPARKPKGYHPGFSDVKAPDPKLEEITPEHRCDTVHERT